MEKAHQSVAVGHLFQHGHGELIVVCRGVGIGIYRRDLMLGRSHLIVLGFGEYTQLPQFQVQIMHELRYPGPDGAVVVVVQLLSLGRPGTEQRSAAQLQILPLLIDLLINKEILLLRSHLGDHMLGLRVAEQPQNADALLIQPAHGAQQGGLLIQYLPAVGAEYRGDIQGLVLYKGIGGGIPGGVAPGLKGGPQAAGGEGGGVRLTPGQLLAGQLHDNGILAIGGDKAVMLFCGHACHGLEPVGVVGSAHFRGPVLHGRGDLVGNGALQGGALGHALPPCFVSVGR